MHHFHHKAYEVHQHRLRELEDKTDKFLNRFEAEFADRDQRRVEREQRWELEKKELEARLPHRILGERIALAMSLVLFACAIGLAAFGLVLGEPYPFAGSVTLAAAAAGMVRLVLVRESEAVARRAG
jgi:hypothetical protein